METENNLGLSMDAWKGTDIEKGIYQDNLEKDLEKGFSETPEAKKEEGKPQPPTVAETHAGEMEAKALKQKETAAMDKKHSYDKMDSSHQKAIRVLLNIEGKSAKEKIETIMEQFGVSKMGAINILADATKELPKPEQPEGEKKEIEKSLEGGKADNMSIEDIAKKHRVEVSEIEKQLAMGLKVETEHTADKAKAREIALDHLVESASYYTKLKTMESKDDFKKGLDHTFDEIGLYDNDLEKAVPIGTVNKYGKIKTADGWVYQKGQGSKGGAKTEAPKEEGKNNRKDSDDQGKIDHYTEMANDKNATPQKRSYARKQIAKYSDAGDGKESSSLSSTDIDGKKIQIGDAVKVSRSLTSDPVNKQGQDGEIIDMNNYGDVVLKFSDGTKGSYREGTVILLTKGSSKK